MKPTATIIPLPATVRLECSQCGADGEGSCRCGAPYVEAGTRAAEGIAEHPHLSDRAIGKLKGVSHTTVQKARRSTGNRLPVEKRTGRDGKARKMPKAKAANGFLCEANPRVTAFLNEGAFIEAFCRRVEEWFNTGPALDDEARHALVHYLTMQSIEIGRIAQKIDGRG